MKQYLLFLTLALLSLALILGSAGCSSSDDPTGSSEPSSITANGSLAPVSRSQAQGTLFVADQSGNPVTGLSASNITARMKWGTPKVAVIDSLTGAVILQTLSQSGKNIAVAMTMDYSGSMFVGALDQTTQKYRRILDMEGAVKTFVDAMGSSDRAEIIKFGSLSSIKVIQTFISDKALLRRAADSLSSDYGYTALYSSIVRGVLDASGQSSSSFARAVIAFTDGGENDSNVPRDSIFRASRRHAIPVYTIGLLDSMYHTTPPGGNSSAERDLVQIADSTGGFYFYAPNAAQLAQIYQRISGQLSNAYSITINWPGTGLPPSGTNVSVTITIVYGGMSSTFTRTYIMP